MLKNKRREGFYERKSARLYDRRGKTADGSATGSGSQKETATATGECLSFVEMPVRGLRADTREQEEAGRRLYGRHAGVIGNGLPLLQRSWLLCVQGMGGERRRRVALLRTKI